MLFQRPVPRAAYAQVWPWPVGIDLIRAVNRAHFPDMPLGRNLTNLMVFGAVVTFHVDRQMCTQSSLAQFLEMTSRTVGTALAFLMRRDLVIKGAGDRYVPSDRVHTDQLGNIQRLVETVGDRLLTAPKMGSQIVA
ncbi:MAG TPA: hypothetical protein VIH63_05025 [Xanthobacteraceae bacterium]